MPTVRSLVPPPVPRHHGLGIMAKHWLPGFVKTRLAADTTAAAAAEIHRLLTLHLTDSLRQCANDRVLFTTPTTACRPVSDAVGPNWNVQPQCEGDLGTRMQAAFRTLEQASNGRHVSMILLGADLPSVTSADLNQAFAALEHNDLVLGPATDGGYYLIGLKSDRQVDRTGLPTGAETDNRTGFETGVEPSDRYACLFRDIPWSTPAVLDTTLQVAQQVGLTVHLLDQQTDIDTLADLRQALAMPSLARGLREQLTTILEAL